MIAASINKYGPEEILRIENHPVPQIGPADVLVKIHAASVNPIDFKIRDGKLKFLRSYHFPLILGHDCAGEVIEVGSKVTRFKVGDRVFSRPRNGRIGTFAEFIAIDQNEVALMPANLNYVEAASIPLVGLTCWQALIDVAMLKPKQKVLIQAGAGGIGTFAIQLAKHIGAEVWTTTSTKNIEFVQKLGADHVIDYKTEKFEDLAKDMDVVFDTLGGESLDKSFSITKPNGWVVSISGSPDYQTGKDMNLSLGKSLVLGLVGLKVNMRAMSKGVHYRFIFMKSSGEELEQISHLLESGIIKPVIDKVFPISESQAALEYSSSGKARGKIIVRLLD